MTSDSDVGWRDMSSDTTLAGKKNPLLGTLAVESGLVSRDQLREALAAQAKALEENPAAAPSIGSFLVARCVITPDQLNELLVKQRKLIARQIGREPWEIPQASIADRYVVLNEISNRTHRVAYEAIDRQLGRKVTMDVLLPQKFRDQNARAREEERFERSVRIHATIGSHPNITSLHDVGVFEGQRFIAIEWIARRTLANVIEGCGHDYVAAIRMLADVARAVEHLHAKGFLHRNLKPVNIYVDDHDRAVLADFSLAVSVREDLPDADATIPSGTPPYMSPEQSLGARRLNPRSDIYALGAILFEILTGRILFEGSTVEILEQHAHAKPESPAAVAREKSRRAVAAPLEALCLAALAKKPEDRPASAKEFAEQLEHWLDQEAAAVTLAPAHRKIMLAALAVATLGTAAIASLLLLF